MGRKIILIAVLLCLGALWASQFAYAQTDDIFHNSGLKIPRFVSLRSDKVFVRTGPALRYPIKWVYKREGLPIEIIQEFDTWRKIRDRDGEEGWIHQSLLSGKRHAVVVSDLDVFMLKKPISTTKRVVQIENDGLVSLQKCNPLWCKAEIKGFSGWIERKSLWGVYESEELD